MPPGFLAALLLCVLVGLSLGLLGGGGSTLALPVLVYVARMDVHAAVGASLAVVGATALAAGILHWRQGRVSPRAVALFGGGGMLAAPLGARATQLVSDRVLLALFGGLMLLVGVLMLCGPRRPSPAGAVSKPRPIALVLAGIGVGLLTGFLGVGGGFLIVPGLTLLAGLGIESAIGSSLVVIAMNSAAGVAAHLHEGELPVSQTLAFTASATAGAFAGTRLARRLDARRLRTGFAVFVIAVGLVVLARNAM